MDIQEIANNTFTISALLLTASIILLNYSWQKFHKLLSTMPNDKRHVIFNLKNITDSNEHQKYEYIFVQCISCVSFAITLIGAVLAINEMALVMTGEYSGFYAQDNFEFAVVSMRVSAFCLFVGIFCSSILYTEEFGAVVSGRNSIVTSPLINLPERRIEISVSNNYYFWIMLAFIVILGLIEIIIPTNQWYKMGIALIVSIIILLIAHYGFRYYISHSSRNINEP